MLIRRPRPKQGYKFAWRPLWTEEGEVWLEWVYFDWNDTEFGSYIYHRWDAEPVPSPKKRNCDGHGHLTKPPPFSTHAHPTFYETPPDISKCKELRDDGPTPCRYPHCTCMNVGGSTCTYQSPHTYDAEKER